MDGLPSDDDSPSLALAVGVAADGNDDVLPDEVVVSDAEGSDQCQDCLPSDDEFGWQNPDLTKACCNKKCTESFLEGGTVPDNLLDFWSHLRAFESNDDATKFLYRLLQAAANAGRKFMLLGHPTCKEAFRTLCLCGSGKIQRLRQHLVHGYVDPPRDLRHSSAAAASCTGTTKADTANSFFADVWNHGQPFADDDLQAVTVGSTEYGGEIVVAGPRVVNSCAEWVTGVGATTPYTEALSGDIRWIPEEPLVDLYEQLRTWCGQTEAECPSYSTMYRAWTETWSHRIHMKPLGHMGKCDDCERFKQLRRLATSPEDHARIRKHFHEHLLTAVYAPRAVDTHLAFCSERSLRGLTPLLDVSNLIRSMIDAMEQAKLKMPRNIAMAKQFSTMWRPNCALFGALAFNELECFWVVDPDVVKEANLECTLLARLLHHVSESITVPMPHQWSNHCDNATGEGKNQIVGKIYAWQVWKRTFHVCEMTNSKVGHGHNEQDQRFAEASTAVTNARVLQWPGDFVNVIQQTVAPRKNRTLIVERLRAALDWKNFFAVLPTLMSGHTQTKNMKLAQVEACHVWRFVCREHFDFRGSISTAWPDIAPHGRDVILLVKHTIDASTYSQDPVVFATHQHMLKLANGPASCAARGKLSARQVHEFSITAQKIGARPWLMTEGATWMNQWIKDNQDGHSPEWVPPCIDWVLSDHPASATPMIPSSLIASDVCFTETTPGEIKIGSKPIRPDQDALPEQEPRDRGHNLVY